MAEAPAVTTAPVVTAPVVTAPVTAPVATAPVTTPVTAPVTAPVTTPPVVAPAAPDWLTGADADTTGLATLKGWKSPTDVVQAYKHAQSFIGADPKTVVRLPGADADKATKDAFYTALGRPAEAKGYDIQVPTGADTTYADFARNTFHEIGLTAEQGKTLALKNNEFIANSAKAADDARTAEWAKQNDTLQKDWGAAFPQNKALVDKAIHALGMDDATLTQLRDTMGPLKAMKFVHQLATKIGEDSFITPETKATGFSQVLTPDAANARINELRKDKDWAKAYLNGDTAKKAEMAQLMQWANPAIANG